LVNTTGECVGINSQILSPSGGNIGIGFAIPSNMAKAVMDQLLKTGKVSRGMLGVSIQPVDADLAASMDLPAAQGAIVTNVQSAGPAEKAGIKRGDVIVGINNRTIVDSNALRNIVASIAPGTNVKVSALRDGREQNFQVALAELPEDKPSNSDADTENDATAVRSGKFGLSLQPLTTDSASRFGLEATDQGLLIIRVNSDGNAAEAGLRQGDLIQEVNRRPVRTIADFTAAVQQSGSRPVLLLIKRREAVIYVTLRQDS
jgi:S1-C subfamily serine protease